MGFGDRETELGQDTSTSEPRLPRHKKGVIVCGIKNGVLYTQHLVDKTGGQRVA